MSGKHFLAALSVAALAGFCVVPFPAYAEIRLVHDAPDATNLSVRSAMDADIPRRTATARMKDKDILFITNRKIDYAADRIAQQRNEVLRSEDVFLKEPAVALTYGVATVSYPVNRRRGDQTYKSESDKQNPLFHFSLKSWEFAQSPVEFENLISGLQPESTSKAALLYVHGFENSFNNAAERLTQIAIDTNYAGRALLFSWPANNWLFGPSRGDYLRTAEIARASRPYLAYTISELAKLSGQPINILAHSMGTDLAANGIMLEMRETHTDQSLPAETVRLIVLAAPDISTRDFEQNLRPNLVRPNVHMIVYCSLDLALELSQAFNLSDERLGHCAITARPHTMRGVDLVTVTGVQKFASHSYYLSAVTILDDIEKAFANGSAGGTSTSSGMVRRLDVH